MALLPPSAFSFGVPLPTWAKEVEVRAHSWLLRPLWWGCTPYGVLRSIHDFPGLWRRPHPPVGPIWYWGGLLTAAGILGSAAFWFNGLSFRIEPAMRELCLRRTYFWLPMSRTTFPVAPGSRLLLVAPKRKPKFSIRPATAIRLESEGVSHDLGRMDWRFARKMQERLNGICANLPVVLVEQDEPVPAEA